METTVINRLKAVIFVFLGLASAAMGSYVAEADDAPGAGGMGILLLAAGLVLARRAIRNRLPRWATITALAVGLIITALAADLTRAVAAAVPLFPPSQDVPSVAGTASSSGDAALVRRVERARELVRAAVLAQNLPGLSVAVGSGDTLMWAEGFGWRDVETRTSVTPETRFNIGTAATAVVPAVASLGLPHTGSEPAAAWSPGHIGEPEEDPPPFTIIRNVIFRPLGLASPAEPLPGDRATFYVPRYDDNPRRGRRLMYMRDLACCDGGKAFYSTPSDLVRVARTTHPGNITGELAGGRVMSLLAPADSGVVVVVMANIAHADTDALARKILAVVTAPTVD